jgi:hypothetical protein
MSSAECSDEREAPRRKAVASVAFAERGSDEREAPRRKAVASLLALCSFPFTSGEMFFRITQ